MELWDFSCIFVFSIIKAIFMVNDLLLFLCLFFLFFSNKAFVPPYIFTTLEAPLSKIRLLTDIQLHLSHLQTSRSSSPAFLKGLVLYACRWEELLLI